MIAEKRRKKRSVTFEKRILVSAILAGLPSSALVLGYLWFSDFTPKLQWTITLLIVCLWMGFAFSVRRQVVRPLQTIANLLSALGEGDYSIRGKKARPDDALGEVMIEVNALSQTLQQQRLGALEATALLRTIMAEIDVAIFAFDAQEHLLLVNRAGEKLLGHPAEWLNGRSAQELVLSECLHGEPSRILEIAFPGSSGRWELRRTTFRQGGLPHQLIVLSDLSRALREEERLAWQRIIRVIGHELNNSLAPIKSIAGSLETLLNRGPRTEDLEDMKQGLSVIAARSESLSNFMESYARLARLPQPKFDKMDVESWIHHAAGLETRLPVEIVLGPSVCIEADRQQLDQLLINLIRNAVDAGLETNGGVRVGWSVNSERLEVWVEDDGPGLSNTSNLFVPFFTTKPGGSGIGLVLSRQIAEAHHGSISIENRTDHSGCIARLRLPIAQD
ncbi:MAG: PAS domain-containing sensor histidine kinase [Acidobacteria bacterium]|nr:MAG: PAS domain-containing sensor histidine kinase [Acidobacteriota bacterium]